MAIWGNLLCNSPTTVRISASDTSENDRDFTSIAKIISDDLRSCHTVISLQVTANIHKIVTESIGNFSFVCQNVLTNDKWMGKLWFDFFSSNYCVRDIPVFLAVVSRFFDQAVKICSASFTQHSCQSASIALISCDSLVRFCLQINLIQLFPFKASIPQSSCDPRLLILLVWLSVISFEFLDSASHTNQLNELVICSIHIITQSFLPCVHFAVLPSGKW